MELFWITPNGEQILAQVLAIAREHQFDAAKIALKVKSRISSVSASELTQAIEIVLAREKASQRLGQWAQDGLFTKQSAEQATRPEIAKHHTKRFASCKYVLEIGTGVGMDCAAIAAVATKVTTLELNPEIAAMAKHNLAVRGIKNVEVLSIGLEEFISSGKLSEIDGIWCDPSRRSEDGERLRGIESYSPKFSELMALDVSGPVGVKLSPVDTVQDSRVAIQEWIGFADECLELVAWRNMNGAPVQVTLADKEITWECAQDLKPAGRIGDERPKYLVEVHSALSASGQSDRFFAQREMRLVDDHYGWGGTDSKPEKSPWYESFRVLEALSLDRKKLSKRLSELNWSSRTEIKKRGFDISPDELRRELKLAKPKGEQSPYGVVMITKWNGKPAVFLTQRV